MASHWRSVAKMASHAKNLAIRLCPSSLIEPYLISSSLHHDIPPILFPEVPHKLSELLAVGVTRDRAQLIHARFLETVQDIDTTFSAIYQSGAKDFWETPLAGCSRSAYIQATQSHLILVRFQAVDRLWHTLLSQARSFLSQSQPIRETPSTSASSYSVQCVTAGKRKRQGRPSTFTSEQTLALKALLAHADQHSSEEKQFIAQELNLTRDQVNRWFCNARARKKPRCRSSSRAGSSDSVTTASSDLTNTNSNQVPQSSTSPQMPNANIGHSSQSSSSHRPSPMPRNTQHYDASHLAMPSTTLNPTRQVQDHHSLTAYMRYSESLLSDSSRDDSIENSHNHPNQLPSTVPSFNYCPTNVNPNAPPLASSSSYVDSQQLSTNAPIYQPGCSGLQEWPLDPMTGFDGSLLNALPFNSFHSFSNLPHASSESTGPQPQQWPCESMLNLGDTSRNAVAVDPAQRIPMYPPVSQPSPLLNDPFIGYDGVQ